MIILSIADKEYSLPTHLSELTIHQGREIEAIRQDWQDQEQDLLFKSWILSVLIGAPLEDIQKVDDSQLNIIYDSLTYLNDNVLVSFSHTFFLNGRGYSLMDLDNMTVAEYAEIESYLDNGIYENLHNLLAVLYRPLINRSFRPIYIIRRAISRLNKKVVIGSEFKGKPVKDLEQDYKHRAALFEQCIPYHAAVGMVSHYLQFKTKLLRDYQLIDSIEEKETDQDEANIRHSKKSVAEMWGMYHLLEVVSNGSLIELEHWMTKPIKQLLTKAFYLRQRSLSN